jgi:CHAD domain-containing protein
MAYTIGSSEHIGEALIRLARADLHAVRTGLSGRGPASARIHRARQRLKRVRSLLKVLRPACAESADLARAKATEAARLLAGARDADAAAESARELLLESAQAREIALDQLVSSLADEAVASHYRTPPIYRVVRLVEEADEALAKTDPSGFAGRKLLQTALRRAYRRGHKAWRRARSSLAMPDLHRWRKDVKHLWHLLRLARKRLPADAKKNARQLEKISSLLGLDHDNAILAGKLVDRPDGPELMSQLSLIAGKRRSLERNAFARGARLYGRKRRRMRRVLTPN